MTIGLDITNGAHGTRVHALFIFYGAPKERSCKWLQVLSEPLPLRLSFAVPFLRSYHYVKPCGSFNNPCFTPEINFGEEYNPSSFRGYTGWNEHG